MFRQSSRDLNDFKFTRWLLALMIMVSLMATLWALSSHLWDRYQVAKDVQNSYWMARYQDPDLFATDYLSKHRLVEIEVFGFQLILHPRSLGYGLFFYLASFLIDHIWLSKWLIFILLPLCVIYLFNVGRFVVGDNLTAISLSLLFVFFILASYQSISPASGLQRAFAIPLLIAFIYYMLREKYFGAGVIMVLSALFYWPVLPLLVLAYGLSLIDIKPGFKVSLAISRAKLWPLVGSLLMAMVFVVLELAVEFQAFVPKDVTVLENPHFQAEGAAPLFISFPWFGRAGIFDAGTDVINFIVLLILGVLIYRVVGRQSFRRMPRVCWHLLAAGIIMYAASFFFLVGLSSSLLYQPSRYTRTTLFLVTLCFVGLNWGDFLAKAPAWFRRKAPLLIFFVASLTLALGVTYLLLPAQLLLPLLLWFVGLILSGVVVVLGGSSWFWIIEAWPRLGGLRRFVLPVIIAITVMLAGTFYIRTLGVRPINPSEAERDIYGFVSSLPKDAVLAGEPVVMSGIPLFSKRSVLFRDLHPNVNPRVSVLILDYFDAQYAETSETVVDFCRRYRISHLVLDTADYAPDYLARGEFFYQPWNDRIVDMVAARSNFVLPEIQPVFTSGPYRVIKCDAETLLARSK